MDYRLKPVVGLIDKVKYSTAIKLCVIGFVMLVLQIPMLMVEELNWDRQQRQNSVGGEIAEKWGGEQTVGGPAIVIPFETIVKTTERKDDGTEREIAKTSIVWQTILPDALEIDGVATPEVRERGIYQTVVYQSSIKMRGRFVIPEGPAGGVLMTNGIRCAIAISDIKGIGSVAGNMNGKDCSFLAGVDQNFWFRSGMAVVADDVASIKPGSSIDFEFSIGLQGSSGWFFLPLGKSFIMNLKASWGSPSFAGGFLPVGRELAADSFTARWETSELNRQYPQNWTGKAYAPGERDALGVNLVLPANHYQKVDRALEYSILVIIIVMLTLFISEINLKVWMHPFQYFVAGLSLVMFYCLTLSIAEHAGFNFAYAVSAIVISCMMGCYCAAVFSGKKASVVIALVMLASYGVVYFILQMENMALLFGTAVLLVLLACVMALTGNINRVAEK